MPFLPSNQQRQSTGCSSSSSSGRHKTGNAERSGDEASGTDAALSETASSTVVIRGGHAAPVTSCLLAGRSHVMTSSLDGTVKLWRRTGSQLDRSLDCASPVHKAVCVVVGAAEVARPDGQQRTRCADVSAAGTNDTSAVVRSVDRLCVLAGTESGNLVVWFVAVAAVTDSDVQRNQIFQTDTTTETDSWPRDWPTRPKLWPSDRSRGAHSGLDSSAPKGLVWRPSKVVHGSSLCDPIQPNPSAD